MFTKKVKENGQFESILSVINGETYDPIIYIFF